jgi:hypothetical protein
MLGLRIKEPRLLLTKLVVIFVPVYAIAYLSNNMVYVLPTLAIGVLLGASMSQNSKKDDADADGDAGDG